MGLFEFVKDIGANIFGGGKDEADEIEALLNKDLAGQIRDLKVEFADGQVTLSGSCESHAAKEKAVLLAGNINGVANVNADALSAPEPKEKTQFYTVKSGDSLSKIAKEFYGDAMKYPVIFEANREVIKNPDLIYPGQQLRIPSA